MSWLGAIAIDSWSWVLAEEEQRKLRVVKSAIDLVADAATGRVDQVVKDAIQIAADTADLTGNGSAAKTLGQIAGAIDLGSDVGKGGSLLSPGSQSLGVTLAIRGGAAALAGTVGAIATQQAGAFFTYAKMGDSAVKGAAGGLAKPIEVAARLGAAGIGGAIGAELDERRGADMGLSYGLRIDAAVNLDNGGLSAVRVATRVAATGAGMVAGNTLALRTKNGHETFNARAFAAVSGIAEAPLEITATATSKGATSAEKLAETVRAAATLTGNILSYAAEVGRARHNVTNSTVALARRAAGGIASASDGAADLNNLAPP